MSRADPYMARCRELAIAAGLDPDARVEKSGSERGMPVWCTFRDAARAEHVAREQAAIEIPPQAAEYQNSPLTVFGEHEDRPSRRCATA